MMHRRCWLIRCEQIIDTATYHVQWMGSDTRAFFVVMTLLYEMPDEKWGPDNEGGFIVHYSVLTALAPLFTNASEWMIPLSCPSARVKGPVKMPRPKKAQS